jgi:amino acid permease
MPSFALLSNRSWGTFVFTFVSQHTVNLAFESLKPEIRTIDTWKKVSTWSLLTASVISLTVGLVVYMTFWQDTQSDLFDMYPPMKIVDLAKLLLCVTMLLTFPLPFFSCRELLIVSLIRPLLEEQQQQHTSSSLLMEPLLPDEEHTTNELAENDNNVDSTSVIFEDPIHHRRSNALCQKISSCYSDTTVNFSIMVPGEEKQLALTYHVALSVIFWGGCTFLALASPNLGDILNLVGSATGTAMAFILPGLLSFKLHGYTRLASFILAFGGPIGFVGTICSLKKLVGDM